MAEKMEKYVAVVVVHGECCTQGHLAIEEFWAASRKKAGAAMTAMRRRLSRTFDVGEGKLIGPIKMLHD